jgi:4-hydroxyphenylacetate 3-monooxygenase
VPDGTHAARDDRQWMDRIKLMKLAWDTLGSEFGSRHVQYEMFYSGPRTTTASMVYRTCDWTHADHMLDSVLHSYDSPALSEPSQ